MCCRYLPTSLAGHVKGVVIAVCLAGGEGWWETMEREDRCVAAEMV